MADALNQVTIAAVTEIVSDAATAQINNRIDTVIALFSPQKYSPTGVTGANGQGVSFGRFNHIDELVRSELVDVLTKLKIAITAAPAS